MIRRVRRFAGVGVVALAFALAGAGCGGGGSSNPAPVDPGNPSEPPPDDPGPDPNCETGKSYAGTFDAIQDRIFEAHGCTTDLCHGSSAQGGLQLTGDQVYENIFNKKASATSMKLIEPGDNDRSFLWLKLAAATIPGTVQIVGSPMPNGLPPLSADELELVRLWIYGGAPKTGTVLGSEKLIQGCLPPPVPISIEPLPPPAPNEGVQFVMPPWDLPKASEFEGCMATWYDFSDQVPAEFLDPTGEYFVWKGFELRQDPESHHLLLYYSPLNLRPGGIDVNDPSFGTWTCYGGAQQGAVCDPKQRDACGEGSVCASRLEASFACTGYGPFGGGPAEIVGGAGQAQAFIDFPTGVYQQLPIRGVMYWNTHAFNLTSADHVMNGRVNYFFATEREHQTLRISDFSAIFTPNNPPFTKETFCNKHVFPVGSRVFHLFSHTHSHGEHFWVTAPDGSRIYENFDFSDPVQARYDPPLEFDSPNAKDRTVEYCGTFNNGVNSDGSFNPERVTRASRVPESAREFLGACQPVACVNEGMVGKPCRGENDDAACDTAPGKGDGFCDACPITGGESTQNEMFVLFGAQYIDPTVPGAEIDLLPYPENQ